MSNDSDIKVGEYMKVNMIYKENVIRETTFDVITSQKHSVKKGARWEVNGLNLQVVNMEINQPDNYMNLNFDDYDKVIDIKSRMN